MSDTEQLFIVAAVWTVIAAFISRFVPNWGGRIALFALLVGVPFWELPYGYYNFHKLCRDDLGLKVFEKIYPQESICIEYFDRNLYRVFSGAGFTRVELVGKSDNARDVLGKDRLVEVSRGEVKSAYCLTFENNIHMPWRVLRTDTTIRRANGGQVVGRQSGFYWTGMWWQHEAKPLLGRGGTCSKDWAEVVVAIRQGTQ